MTRRPVAWGQQRGGGGGGGEGLRWDYWGRRLGPRKRPSPLPAAAAPSNRPPSQQCPFPSPCLCLSSQLFNRPGLSGRERGRMDVPRIRDGAPGAQDRASHLPGGQPSFPHPPGPKPPVLPSSLSPGLQTLKPSRIPSPKPPGASVGFPCSLGLYLLRAERLGPVVQNQALLGPMGVAGRLGCFGGLHRLGRIALQRRDGPPAAVGGGQVIGGRHDSPKSEGRKEAPAVAALSRPASHGLAEPAPLLRSLPPFPVNVITHWASGGGARGIPGAPFLLLPLAHPWPVPEKPPVQGQARWKGTRSHREVGHAPR